MILLYFLDHSEKSQSKTNGEVLWISIGAGSGFVVILLIIILALCRRQRRKKEKERQDREHEEIKLRSLKKAEDERSSTMRARLSQMLEMHSSFSSKIAEMYDPSKLKQFSLDNIEYLSDLGEGQFGLVFKGTYAMYAKLGYFCLLGPCSYTCAKGG